MEKKKFYCNEGLEKRIPKDTGHYSKKPYALSKDFADLYIKGDDKCLPISYVSHLRNDISRLSLKKETKELSEYIKEYYQKRISAIKKNKLNSVTIKKSEIADSIYIALHEFSQAILFDKRLLRRLNRSTVKQGKDAIRHLQKALDCPFLIIKTVIQSEIERLKKFDTLSQEYHPLQEIEFNHHMAYLTNPNDGLLGPKKEQLIAETNEILLRLLNIPQKIKTGTPPKFFFKALQIVIFTYLRQANIPIEKSKLHAANIINEFFEKQNLPEYSNLTAKDIDNAIHS